MLTHALALIRLTSVVQCVIISVEESGKRGNTTQAKVAEIVDTTPSYVSRCLNGKDKVVNKTFISMMVGVDNGG